MDGYPVVTNQYRWWPIGAWLRGFDRSSHRRSSQYRLLGAWCSHKDLVMPLPRAQNGQFFGHRTWGWQQEMEEHGRTVSASWCFQDFPSGMISLGDRVDVEWLLQAALQISWKTPVVPRWFWGTTSILGEATRWASERKPRKPWSSVSSLWWIACKRGCLSKWFIGRVFCKS